MAACMGPPSCRASRIVLHPPQEQSTWIAMLAMWPGLLLSHLLLPPLALTGAVT